MYDNVELEKFVVGEFYHLHKIGLLYASWDGKWAIFSSIQYFIYCTLLSLFTFDFFFTAYLSSSDITLFSQSLHLGIVFIVGWTVLINCAYFRGHLVDIYTHFMNGICNYQSGEYYKGLRSKMIKERERLLIFWPLYYGSCAAVAVIAPIFDRYMGTDPGNPPHPQISYRLPLAIWVPFNIEEGFFLFSFVCIITGMATFIVALVVAAGVVGCVVLMQHLCLQLQLLIHSLETIDKRTEELYIQKEGTPASMIFNHQIYVKYYNECLKENIKHHQIILRYLYKYLNVSQGSVVPLYIDPTGFLRRA
ncbi:hypothetical protein O3M35_003126 [Rhynocoris fuscipes]|uniref:Odorant receptor n=1 Tax=Rhynocoris fuscipes TaxID=488301 RepID=A0AAW1CLY1_9HEMI